MIHSMMYKGVNLIDPVATVSPCVMVNEVKLAEIKSVKYALCTCDILKSSKA
jgi:hypothetical protein